MRRLVAVLSSVTLALSVCVTRPLFSANAQQEKRTKSTKPKGEETDAVEAQQRAMAVSLVTSLADEARSFKDQTRRARVQARAGDVLWDSDREKARELFRSAWAAAQVADEEATKQRAEELRKQLSIDGPVMLRGGGDLRAEVLRIIAKRDRQLGEEFLKALDEASEKERDEAAADQRRNNPGQLGASKRLQLARRLIDDGQVERALEFAGPALDKVSPDSIFFLSALREKNAQLGDAAFATLIARVARDPIADANTVSGLSSYLFTPFFYVTFEKDGGGSGQMRQRDGVSPPSVDPSLRSSFFKLAFQILMQPQPAPEQDHTTAGQTGKYLIIKRLLPLFDQYAADLSPGLRTQMTALASFVPGTFQQGENRAVTAGIVSESEESDPLQRMQERLDRAGKSDDRDAIYADYAVALAGKGDRQARDLVDKIEESELRKSVKAFTDFQLAQAAIRSKDATEAARIVKIGELTSIQKVWALTSATKLVLASERSRASSYLEEALTEARRMSSSDPDKARALTAVASVMTTLDQAQAWEVLGEIVKAANSAEGFTGEDTRIFARMQTKQMVEMSNSSAPDFDLLAVFRPLGRADLNRAAQVAKTFAGEAPRAVATLAVARSVLEKNRDALAGGSN
jgi:hypothetical protein